MIQPAGNFILKTTIQYSDTHVFDEVNERVQVMNGEQCSCQQLLRHYEMANIGARKGLASVASATPVNGALIAGKDSVLQVKATFG